MTRWLTHPLFGPVLALAALGWGTLVVAFLILGPNLGGWATTVLSWCFGWSTTTRTYRLDTVLLVTLQPPLLAAVIAAFYADDLRAVLRRLAGRVAGGAAVTAFVGAAVALALTGRVVGGAAVASAAPLRDGRPAPRATLTDHRGRAFALGVPLGRPVALTFVYADCHATCPALIATLKATATLTGDRALFAAVTLAPERDTPAVLAAYAERWELGAAIHLLSGPPAAVRAVRERLGVGTESLPGGDIAHANVIVLLDGAGRVAFTLPGLGVTPAKVAALLARLATEG
jgi:cytochrome oxidase Cu insertion factor (SCO1/SenC/PrrC family)